MVDIIAVSTYLLEEDLPLVHVEEQTERPGGPFVMKFIEPTCKKLQDPFLSVDDNEC